MAYSYLLNMTNIITNGGSFNGTSSPVAGVAGTFGDPLILGIAGILIMLIIGWKMKVTPDLMIVSTVSMLAVVSDASFSANLLPQWIFWLWVFGGAAIFSLGLIKVIKYR